MPVKIDGTTFQGHDSAVNHLKKSKPGIKNPDAYVATVERAEKTGKQLKARLQLVANKLKDVPESELTEKIKQIKSKKETYNYPERS